MDTQTPASGTDSRQDPSLLTTQQLWREIAGLKELFLTQITDVRRGIDLAHENLTRVPTDIQIALRVLREAHDLQMKHLEELVKERFAIVDREFDAALLSASKLVEIQNEDSERAIQKSEISFSKQIEQLDSKITDIKDRITRWEGQRMGNDTRDRILAMESSSSGKIQMWGFILGAVGAIATILAIISFFILRP